MSAHALRNDALGEIRQGLTFLQRGCEVLRCEINALEQMQAALDPTFAVAVTRILRGTGSVVVTGIGKAGLIGQKVSASFSSTGTPSHFLHPSEAVHGDLGCIRPEDLILLLSYSGETEEVNRLLPMLREMSSGTMAITGSVNSTLSQGVDVVLPVGPLDEAGPLGLAPSCSTTAMLAMGDALALVVSEAKGFTSRQFAKFHPGGSLGRQLADVTEIMRPLDQCRVASMSSTVRQVFVHVSCPGRRTGAIMLTDADGKLRGIFTDSDLARLLEKSGDERLDSPIESLMTREFRTVGSDARFSEAVRILTEFKISELPVVDSQCRPQGIIDITDVVSAVSTSDSGTAEDEPEVLSLVDFLPK